MIQRYGGGDKKTDDDDAIVAPARGREALGVSEFSGYWRNWEAVGRKTSPAGNYADFSLLVDFVDKAAFVQLAHDAFVHHVFIA